MNLLSKLNQTINEELVGIRKRVLRSSYGPRLIPPLNPYPQNENE